VRSAEERETERMRMRKRRRRRRWRRVPAGEQKKRLDTDGIDSRLDFLELSWAICALARFWQCVLSECNANMQGPRDGALNLGALNFGARNPSTFTLVSSPFGPIWRSQFLYYATIPERRWSLIAASADECFSKLKAHAIGCCSSVRALFFSRQDNSTLQFRHG
jgi:hypothetical protein